MEYSTRAVTVSFGDQTWETRLYSDPEVGWIVPLPLDSGEFKATVRDDRDDSQQPTVMMILRPLGRSRVPEWTTPPDVGDSDGPFWYSVLEG